MLKISDFDYTLPKELIAQFPLKDRDASRLLIVDRKSGKLTDADFRDIAGWFKPQDALVLNDTKVKPVRLTGRLISREVDILLVERIEKNLYGVKAKPGGKLKPGTEILFADGKYRAICEPRGEEGFSLPRIRFIQDDDIEKNLEEIGSMPLPPYIKRSSTIEDLSRYQTIYAQNSGAIAAPTAGLHFSEQVLNNLKNHGTKIFSVTLHVGLGTFSPIKTEDVAGHIMHEEEFLLTSQTARALTAVRKSSGRIISVGTTTCRVLESCADISSGNLGFNPGQGKTRVFIYPGYEFKAIDVLITNFHLPRTTLLLLVCAFGGRELMLRAYQHAIEKKYRFFSYGDCMMIV